MPKKRSDDTRIAIPVSALQVKDWFWDLPGNEIIQEIKRFIEQSPHPYLWRGHTHTKPPVGSKPRYLDEIELPAAAVKGGHLSPCPCCTPEHPKYGKGKIAWFPNEGVIRLIGPDCFAAMDQDAHREALEEMRRERKRKRDIDYLLKHQDRLVGAYNALKAAKRVGYAINEFSASLCRTTTDLLNMNMWDYVRTGKLQVSEEFSEMLPEGAFRKLWRIRDYAPIRGHEMLSPTLKNYAYRLQQSIAGLTFLDEEGWKDRIADMSEMDRGQTAQVISNTVKRTRALFAEMRELQEFVSDLNLATMRTWGKLDACPRPLVIERRGPVVFVGRQANAMFPVKIPSHFEDDLRDIDIPTLKEMDSD